MRDRKKITKGKLNSFDVLMRQEENLCLILEVLLDIRDLLKEEKK